MDPSIGLKNKGRDDFFFIGPTLKDNGKLGKTCSHMKLFGVLTVISDSYWIMYVCNVLVLMFKLVCI